jgi:hypothetical protein
MTVFKLLIIILLFPACVTAQAKEKRNDIETSGPLMYPINGVTKVMTYTERKSSSETMESKYISFFSDKSVPVHCVQDCKILKIVKIDSIYVIITTFANYFLTYSGLTKPSFKVGDILKSGQTIAYLKKDYSDRFCLDIYYSNAIEEIDPAALFGK